MRLAILLLAAFSAAFAQDERRVASPDGRLEFRIFTAAQKDTELSRIAYEVWFDGKRVVDTSFMGLDIWDQEPLLGENDGLIGTTKASNPDYNALTVKYMQNGSLGRRLDIEVRAYNGAIAFRYLILRTNPVEKLLIADEATEFAVESPSVKVTETPEPGFPAMHLVREGDSTLLTRLARPPGNPVVAFQGTTPFTFPWRVVVMDDDKQASILAALKK